MYVRCWKLYFEKIVRDVRQFPSVVVWVIDRRLSGWSKLIRKRETLSPLNAFLSAERGWKSAYVSGNVTFKRATANEEYSAGETEMSCERICLAGRAAGIVRAFVH